MVSLTLEQQTRLVEKVGGPEQALRVLSCSQVTVDFSDVATAVVGAVAPRLSVWETIQLGESSMVWLDYLRLIGGNGIFVGEVVFKSLEAPAFACPIAKEEVRLVICSASDFGFESGANYGAICDKAISLGFGLCPIGVAPTLLAGQQKERLVALGSLAVFSEPFLDEHGDPYILDIYKEWKDLYLFPQYTHPECIWGPVHRLVFVAPPWLSA